MMNGQDREWDGGYITPDDPYSAEAETLFAAMSTPPDDTRKGLIDDCIVALKAAGIWTKLDCLYMFAAADSQAALLNWKAPGTFNASVVSAPTFTADTGYTGNGTSSYVTSNFNASTAGGSYVRDAATMFAHGNLSTLLHAGIVGHVTSSNSYIFPFGSSNLCYLTINGDASDVSAASTDGRGLWGVTRRTSTEVEAYKNGASLGSGSIASEALVNENHVFLAGGTAFYTGPVMAGGLGGALSDAEHTSLYGAVHDYLVAVAGIP